MNTQILELNDHQLLDINGGISWSKIIDAGIDFVPVVGTINKTLSAADGPTVGSLIEGAIG